jgi:hypothetical protein
MLKRELLKALRGLPGDVEITLGGGDAVEVVALDKIMGTVVLEPEGAPGITEDVEDGPTDYVLLHGEVEALSEQGA